MGSAQSDALKRAIDYLGAVEVAPGRIAVPENGRWFVMNPHDVQIIADDRAEPFSGNSVRMPSWWTPERRTIIRNSKTGRVYPNGSYWTSPFTHRIGANLETGEETIEA